MKNRWLSQIQNSSSKSHSIMLQFQEIIVKWSLCYLKQSFSFWPKFKIIFACHLPSILRWSVGQSLRESQKTLNCIIKTCKIFMFDLISFNHHLGNKLCLKYTCEGHFAVLANDKLSLIINWLNFIACNAWCWLITVKLSEAYPSRLH